MMWWRPSTPYEVHRSALNIKKGGSICMSAGEVCITQRLGGGGGYSVLTASILSHDRGTAQSLSRAWQIPQPCTLTSFSFHPGLNCQVPEPDWSSPDSRIGTCICDQGLHPITLIWVPRLIQDRQSFAQSVAVNWKWNCFLPPFPAFPSLREEPAKRLANPMANSH